MTPMSRQLAQLRDIVVADVRYLALQGDGLVDDNALRRDSVVLRRLLTDRGEGDIALLWRLSGIEGTPRIEGADIGELTTDTGLEFATADPFRGRGVVTYEVRVYGRIHDEAGPGALARQMLPIAQYMNGGCIYAEGTIIRRSDLIAYVANTRGGAHHGRGKRTGNPRRQHAYDVLDQISTEWSVMNRDAVFAQVLAVGQAVVTSSDIQALIG
jgi:hypothetical protein